MNRSHLVTRIGSALACGVVSSAALQAGGLSRDEIATPDVGLAPAGYAARAEDASTVFKNPAGMSRLRSARSIGCSIWAGISERTSGMTPAGEPGLIRGDVERGRDTIRKPHDRPKPH